MPDPAISDTGLAWLPSSVFDLVPELSDWFARRPRSVFTIPNFLPIEQARALAAALKSHSSWSKSCHANIATGKTVEVPRGDWPKIAGEDRFSSHFVIRPLNELIPAKGMMEDQRRRELMRFAVAAIVGNELREWVSAFACQPLFGPVGCEITRFERDDFIAPHTDHYDGRTLAMVLYLDECEPTDGGTLHFVNEEGHETSERPRFNQMILIPIDASCRHWVTPWQRSAVGREAISLALRAA